MGSNINISHDRFPKQGEDFGREATVLFNYDTTKKLSGVIVRDDMEEPYVTMIKLSDGRIVLASECQYSPKRKGI